MEMGHRCLTFCEIGTMFKKTHVFTHYILYFRNGTRKVLSPVVNKVDKSQQGNNSSTSNSYINLEK